MSGKFLGPLYKHSLRPFTYFDFFMEASKTILTLVEALCGVKLQGDEIGSIFHSHFPVDHRQFL